MTPDGAALPALTGSRPVLITGGAGFIGANLADRLATEGHRVLIYDSLVRQGVSDNLAWLKQRHPRLIASAIADVRDREAMADAAGNAVAVFHLAAQTAVTSSIIDPITDFEVNLGGTVHLLDVLRRRAEPVPLILASTNKVYGDLGDIALETVGDCYLPRDSALRARGIGEDRPLDFHTPYGCSKGAADQYVLDFGRSFDLPTAVLRMSCIYGQRQMGTEDQGWVAHFVLRALRGEPVNIFGDGRQVRDILDVSDAVEAYVSLWRRIGTARGRAYNLGGGPDNAVSLRQVLAHIASLAGHAVPARFAGWRTGDQRYYVSDTSLAARVLGLRARRHWRQGVASLFAQLGNARRPVPVEGAMP